MALLSTVLKSIVAGTKVPAPTHGEMKGALGTVADFATGMLGTDSADKAAARAALGVLDAGGLRNLLINPCFRINQRGWNSAFPVSTTMGSAGSPYFADRWRCGSPSGTYLLTAAGNVFQMTIPSQRNMWQHVDGANIIGGTYQLKWEGTATAKVNNIDVANGGTFTLTAGTNAKIEFISGTLLRPQLERLACGAWETRPTAMETYLCLAYFERASADQWIQVVSGGQVTVRFMARKRAVPTMTVGAGSPLAVTLQSASDKTNELQFTVSMATGGNTAFSWAADSEIYT